MPIVLNGTTGITTPTYNGSTTAEYIVPVTGFKNRIINGDMTINQRGSTVTINSGSGRLYSVDRWSGETNSSGAFTLAQSSTAPAGFTNSIVATVTSTVASAGNTFAFIEQQIEGFNTADFQFGTANAQAFTVSFWARSSVAGTFSAVLGGGSYSYVFNYTLAANTWTYVTQAVPALTVGSGYNTTNGTALKIRVSLYTNGTLGGATGSWINADYTGSTTQTNLLANSGATFNLTGVQIEKGANATSFDYRPYGTELALCQRYYEKSYNVGTVPGTATTDTGSSNLVPGTVGGSEYTSVPLKVPKRANSTITIYNDNTGASGSIRVFNSGGFVGNISTNVDLIGENGFRVAVSRTGDTLFIIQWVASAEL